MNQEVKSFLIVNWFKIAILIILICGVGVYSYQVFVVSPKEKLERKESLDECISNAEYQYRSDWKLNCSAKYDRKLECEKNDAPRYGKSFCESIYTGIRSRTDCSLPLKIADSLDASLKQEKDRCLQLYKLGVN